MTRRLPPDDAFADQTPGHLARLVGWLRDVPVADAVDRRNAAMLQVLLILAGLYQPLVVGYSWMHLGSLVMDVTSLVLAGLSTIADWTAFLLLRRGRLRLAARLFVVLTLALLTATYLHWGLQAQTRVQLTQLVPVLVAGLILSRPALWWSTGWLAVAVLLGSWQDVEAARYEPLQVELTTIYAFRTLIGLVVIAAILDRSVAALRSSLDTAHQRSHDLARTRDRLQLQMNSLARSNAALEAERAERERVQGQLIHAMKVEATGRLASGVAHDFNHLLGLILGHASRARRSDDPAVLKQALEGTESAARRAVAATRKLLDFSRLEESRPETLDLRELLEDMRPMLRQLFDPSIRIVIELGNHAQYVRFDRAQLELIVLNLATNAQQAMPDGGRFTIALPAPAGSPDVALVLSDTGIGMSEDVRRRCMEAFFTTKPAGQGTGLGLAVAAQLLHAANGDIGVDSAPGAGSTFRLTLPRQAGAPVSSIA